MNPCVLSVIATGLVSLASLLGGCYDAAGDVRIMKADFGGSIWAGGQRKAGVLFQDGGQGTPVEGGTLWTFGDTFYGKPAPGKGPENSQITGAHFMTLAFLPAGRMGMPPELEYYTGADGMVTRPLGLLPGENVERTRIWPAGAVSVGKRVYLYYTVVEATEGPVPFNFRGIGAGLAVGEEAVGQYRRVMAGGDWKFPMTPTQVVREGDQLYLYETSNEPKGLILGRVKVAEIEQPGAYEFYTGRGWSRTRANAKVILTEAYGQVSVEWMPTWGMYVMATSSNIFRPREIVLRKASRLEGPWGEIGRITVPELPGKKTVLVYCTYLHPELSRPDGTRLVATFCRTLDGDWQLTNPEWLVITLARGEQVE